jgi:hypothetical protein
MVQSKLARVDNVFPAHSIGRPDLEPALEPFYLCLPRPQLRFAVGVSFFTSLANGVIVVPLLHTRLCINSQALWVELTELGLEMPVR